MVNHFMLHVVNFLTIVLFDPQNIVVWYTMQTSTMHYTEYQYNHICSTIHLHFML